MTRAATAPRPRTASATRAARSAVTLMPMRKSRQIFEHLRAANPHPRSELQFDSPFELLIAVMLSAQATDRSVNLATRELFPIARTPQAMLQLGLAGLKQRIRTIGLYNTKARNILATCEQLIEKHAGQVPREREALEALPGVGRKTANIVLNVAFGESTIGVDTHAFRVANRTGLVRAATPREVEDGLLKVVPPDFLRDAHHWLVLHGRYICTARAPACPRCPIARWCEYEHKTPP
jgi:endonuclease-3